MIQFDDLTLGYERHPAVHHFNWLLEQNSLTAIVGPNGAGKSTLFKGIMGQLKPFSGTIHFRNIKQNAIGYLPQQNQIDRSFPITVSELISLGSWDRCGAFKHIDKSERHHIAETIERIGLTGYENRTISNLSGGQMQRVLFARLMVQQSSLILLDEPFSGIDTKTCDDLLALIQQWHKKDGKTVLAILHDLDQVRQYFPQTLLISRQLVAAGLTQEVLTPEKLLKARNLNEAFDEQAPICRHSGHSA